MKSALCILTLFLVLAASAMAQAPNVPANAILNAASDAFVGLPNSSIAQGSIFTIYGTNLGPSSSPSLAYPLQTTLGGVSVKVTSGGTTVNAVPTFVSPSQINAILPSNTPTGTATLTVSYNNGTSAASSFQVVANSVGIFALNSAGSGPGVITDASYHVYGANTSAQPGDISILWATGLGASPGDDFTGPPPQVDMPNLPLSLYVGAQKADVLYRGRGCCNGEDQINFRIPAGVTGCHVPVAVQIGNIVSNFVTMPIAASGRVCSDSTGPTPTDITNFLLNGGSFGSVLLSRTTITSPGLPPPFGTGQPTTTTSDTGSASFFKYSAQLLSIAQNPFQTYTVGACVVYAFSGQASGSTDPIKAVGLDAGAAINVNGANGAKQLTPLAILGKGYYSATLGGGTPPNATPLYLSQGAYPIDNGGGGADVKGFNFTLTVGPPLTWTNMSSVGPVIRANGQPVTWTGGDPSGTVTITGTSFKQGTNSNGSDTVGAIFICTAPVSAGQFTVPAPVLLSLPVSTVITAAGVSFDTGSLTVGTTSPPLKFTATGLDYGTALSTVNASKTLGYQ